MRALIALPVLAAAGCFDSQWVQAPASQRAAAKSETPPALTASPSGQAVTSRTFKVRVWATQKYVSQTIDWKTELRGLLDDASQVLAPTSGARLEVASSESWSQGGPDDDLSAAAAALATKDPGQDVDWVIGLVGGLPKATYSFHQLGIANVAGKHIVLRASTDLYEIDALEGATTSSRRRSGPRS